MERTKSEWSCPTRYSALAISRFFQLATLSFLTTLRRISLGGGFDSSSSLAFIRKGIETAAAIDRLERIGRDAELH